MVLITNDKKYREKLWRIAFMLARRMGYVLNCKGLFNRESRTYFTTNHFPTKYTFIDKNIKFIIHQ